jgi:drug/metabolite transporter (DMT)-like permease
MFFELFITVIFLGLFPIIMKIILNHVSPVTFTFGYITSLFIIQIIYVSVNYKTLKNDFPIFKDKKNNFIIWLILLSGLVAMISNHYIFNLTKQLNVYYVSTIISVYPIVTAIISYYFLKEKISIYDFIGIILIVCGLITINISKSTF